jgi:hypothetical protein
MAAGEITIWAPVPNGATPAPVTLVTFGDGDGYQRSTFGWQAYESHTPYGTPVVSGAYWRPKYNYALAFTEQDSIYLGLRKLMRWQQLERAARREGRLSLRDEMWDFEAEPPPHSLGLLSQTIDADGWVRGPGTIPSVLLRPAQGPDFGYAGYDARSSQAYKLFQLEVTQL